MPAKHKPVHPGEILEQEFLVPLGMTKYRLAKETGMPADRVGRLVKGTRTFTADTALRLARFFGTTPEFWLSLQARHDLESARQQVGLKIERRVQRYQAA